MAEKAQVFSRLQTKNPLTSIGLPFLEAVNNGMGPIPGDVIEICGEEGCGKSEVLLNILGRSVLGINSAKLNTVGSDIHAVVISTNCKFDLIRLVAIIEGQHASPHKNDVKKQAIQNALSSINVLYCSSLKQLFFTLHSLREFLSTHSSISLIIFDEARTFYSEPSTGTRHQHSQTEWIKLLNELVNDYQLILCISKPLTRGTRDENISASKLKKQNMHTFHCSKNHSTTTYMSEHHDETSFEQWFKIELVSPKHETFTFKITDAGIMF